jgi:hypothetical protein
LAVIAFVASINATDGDVFDGTFSELARTGNMGIARGLDYDDAISEHYRDAAFAQVATRLSNARLRSGVGAGRKMVEACKQRVHERLSVVAQRGRS